MRSPPISPRPAGLTRSLRKFATSSATRLDILVSNAGFRRASPLEDITSRISTNCSPSTFAPLLPGAATASDPRHGSNIVFLSSLGARAAVGTLAAYASTKGAINTLVKYFSAALGPGAASASTPSRPRDRHRHVELRRQKKAARP